MWIYARWAITIVSVVMLAFWWWRGLRSEYKESTIHSLTFRVFLWVLVVGVAGKRIVYGTWGWWEGSGLIAGMAVVWYTCRKEKGDIWEWTDIISLPVLTWGVIMYLTWGMYLRAGLLAGATLFGWITSKTYRKWRWYKSGRPGAVGMVSIVGWGIVQVAVAFIQPDKLYWGELTANQWIGSWILTAAVVGLYLRSGKKLWIKNKPKRTVQ